MKVRPPRISSGFIHGIVGRIIHSHRMTDLVYESTSEKMDITESKSVTPERAAQ